MPILDEKRKHCVKADVRSSLFVRKKNVGEGIFRVTNLAMIAACIGDKDLAFEQLESIIRLPSPLSYGGLKLFPWWDPLRGNPRFEKLLEEAKQPVGLK